MHTKENLTQVENTDGPTPDGMKHPLDLLTDRRSISAGDPYSNPRQDRSSRPDSDTIPDLETVKARQKATWESGDFGRIARTIENVAEEFMARPTLQAGTKVLDVACGTGNLAVIAAR